MNPSPLDPLLQELAKKDFLTYQHTVAVAERMQQLAKALDLQEGAVGDATLLGTIHDMAKLKVPAGVFKKLQSGMPISDSERRLLRGGPEELFEVVGREMLPEGVKKAVEHLRCRFDGAGEPALSGERIHLLARMLLVADYHDMLTRQRTGSRGLGREQADELLRRQSGRIFDPEIVKVFLSK